MNARGTSNFPETTSRSVTFARPFTLPGMDAAHRPGTFEARETRETLDVMHEAYLITRRIVLVDGGRTELLEVSADELASALALDVAEVIGSDGKPAR